MKKYALLFSVIIIFISLTSCRYFKRSSDTKLVYVVEKKSVNVTEKLSPYSKVIGKLHRGDTIVSTGFLIGSVPFIYKGSLAYVSDKDVKGFRIADKTKVSNMQLSKTGTIIRDSLNNYVNWRKGIFWLIALASVLLAWALTAIGKSLETSIDYWVGDYYSYNRLPYYTAIVGGLYSFAYMFWREDVLQAFFVTKFWWFPQKGSDWLLYYLWSASLILVLSIVYFFLRDLFRYGFKSLFTILFYTITSSVTFVMGLFLGVLVVVVGFVWLFLLITGEFSSGGSGYSGGGIKVPSGSGGPSREDKFRLFRQREDEFQAGLKASELRSKLDWERMKMKDD